MKRPKQKRNTLPRRSSPKGIAARMALRQKGFLENKDDSYYNQPGSTNPRKAGR